MTVELVKGETQSSICVNDMEDGQLAKIVAWRADGCDYTSRIVQRVNKDIITVGGGEGRKFGTILNNRHEDCRVRLLEPGDMIRVVSNTGG